MNVQTARGRYGSVFRTAGRFSRSVSSRLSDLKLIAKLHNAGMTGFDPQFYLSHYEDLPANLSPKRALAHYLRHGQSEGRFANEREYEQFIESFGPEFQANFDATAYKFFNKDLAGKFETKDELFRHYVRHGFREGRRCRFEPTDGSLQACEKTELWASSFVASEFLAWCGDALDVLPNSREEALDIFREEGISRQWPINFRYRFDANFVRNNGSPIGTGATDTALYSWWLAEGFPSDVAPNERVFLEPYLGGLPYPRTFDWETFARSVNLPQGTTRSRALIALFQETSHKILKNIKVLGGDAGWLLDRIGRRALISGDHAKAAAMFDRSAAFLPSAEVLCLLGDAHRGLGEVDAALQAYSESGEAEQPPIWAFLHTATIYASQHKFDDAFGALRKGFPEWRHKVEFRQKLHEIIGLFFEHQSGRAHALYRELNNPDTVADRNAIDKLLEKSLDRIVRVYQELDALPARTGGDSEGYVAILANDDLRQCTHYRVEQKVMQFEAAGIPVRVFSHTDPQKFLDALIGARAAIFYRVAALPGILRAILHANSLGLATYYEIDDLIFDSSSYPESFESYEQQISRAEYAGLQFGVPLFRYAMTQCQANIASTPALGDRMRDLSGGNPTIILRNGLDQRNIAAVWMGETLGRNSGRIRVFYGSGTKAHNADFNSLVAPGLAELMETHKNLDLVIVGHLKLDKQLQRFANRIIVFPFVNDITSYWSVLASCDVNIAVLQESSVTDCKSEIKWLEAAVLRVASIVSSTRTFREIITDGIDGFIATCASDWTAALQKCISRPELCQNVADAARRKALRDYDQQIGADVLSKTFNDLPSPPPKAAKFRVLVCNVFFAPQSYGGATRVVEDNVQAFQDLFPDVELAVFSSDEGVAPAGRLSQTAEKGIPVYRLSTPVEIDMDRRPFNDDNIEPFERVLDHFKPDLVHFHCIQRLTASIVEVALQRDIPYVVTLHDAWWISDNQFLVDSDGLLAPATPDVFTDSAGGDDQLASIARRQRLASLLRHAAARLSVSESFADVYRDAGIDDIAVCANGMPVMSRHEHNRRTDNRVALAHVGGRAAHKGAPLIEAALRRGEFAHLHLTMIDGTLGPGQSVDTIWGTTPVTLRAPVPQSQMAKFYANFAVLLAPSTWPESFGLVTREALECGLWVVASNRGAIGLAVTDGANGFVIDVSTTRGLRSALLAIDEDPARFQIPPQVSNSDLRTSRDQAADLYDLYVSLHSQTKHKSSLNAKRPPPLASAIRSGS